MTEFKKSPLPVNVNRSSSRNRLECLLPTLRPRSQPLCRFPETPINSLNSEDWDTHPWRNRRKKTTISWRLKEQRRIKHSSMINSSFKIAPRNPFHKDFTFTIRKSSKYRLNQTATTPIKNDGFYHAIQCS